MKTIQLGKKAVTKLFGEFSTKGGGGSHLRLDKALVSAADAETSAATP